MRSSELAAAANVGQAVAPPDPTAGAFFDVDNTIMRGASIYQAFLCKSFVADHIDLSDHAFEAYPTEAWDFERLKTRCFFSNVSGTFFSGPK